MRVAFLTHNYPRHPGDVPGGFLAALARALVARGHEVRVVAPRDAGRGGEGPLDAVHVRRVRYAPARWERIAYRGAMLGALRSPAGLLALAGLGRALRRAAREEMARGADLIHAHWWVPAGLAVPRGARMVLTVHGTDAALLARSRVARRLARPVLRRATVLTTVSRYLAGLVERHAGRAIPADHVHPMPPPALPPQPAPRGSGRDRPGSLLVVARLTRQKRLDLALHAAALLRDRGNAVPLVVAGDGPERGGLEALRARLGLGGLVRFEGAVPPTRVHALLAEAAVLLQPAVGEGFGLTAAEALMCGVPVVACADGGGLLEIVPADGAGRHAAPNPEGIADAAAALLHDPEAPVAAAALGRAWRERLDPDRVARQCERWYEEALGG